MVNNPARNIKQSHFNRLFSLALNKCSYPGCTVQLFAKDEATNRSTVAHIEAVSKTGAKYNPDMTDDDRRHFDNLIILCYEHHRMIDNPENEGKYPVEVIKQWKTDHKNKKEEHFNRNSSPLLMQVINAISAIELDEETDKPNKKDTAFNIEGKITYNALKRNRSLIKEYSPYYAKINAVYSELESHGAVFKKELLLRNIRAIYVRTKGRYIEDGTNEQEIIQAHADDIFEEVEEQLYDMVEELKGDYGSVSFAMSIVMVDAFMRCKILEEPPDDFRT